jgi:ketosteroid isomerase-like protein
MSANLDLVRSIHATWEHGDWSANDWADPEIEFVIADGPQPGRWTGLAGMAEGWRAWLSAWADFRGKADEYRELDGECILVSFHFSGTGKSSGLELTRAWSKGANVFHVRTGKVARLVVYLDRDRALADLGLKE